MTDIQYLLELYNTLVESYKILNDHSGIMSVDIAILKTQMSEILWWGRFIVGGIIAIIIERIVNGVMTYNKNNGKKKKK